MSVKKSLKNMLQFSASILAHLYKKSSIMSSAEADNILSSTSQRPLGTCVGNNQLITADGSMKYDLQIIIPCYNVEKYIEECMDSIVSNLKDTDYKVIATVINDGSKDNTSTILHKYIDLILDNPILNRGGYKQSIELIEQENKGFSGARNTGLKKLKGKYITFLDSDDLLADGAFDALLSAAYKNDYDIVQGAWKTFSNKKNLSDRKEVVIPIALSGYPWGKCYKAEIFEHFQFPEGYWFEDTPLSFFLYYLKKKDGKQLHNGVVDDWIYCYRINPNGITATSAKRNKSIDSYYITELCLEEFPEFGIEYDQRAYEYFLRQTVMNYIRTKHLSSSVREAVFVMECELKGKYFDGFKTNQKNFLPIEKALTKKRYRSFELSVWSIK